MAYQRFGKNECSRVTRHCAKHSAAANSRLHLSLTICHQKGASSRARSPALALLRTNDRTMCQHIMQYTQIMTKFCGQATGVPFFMAMAKASLATCCSLALSSAAEFRLRASLHAPAHTESHDRHLGNTSRAQLYSSRQGIDTSNSPRRYSLLSAVWHCICNSMRPFTKSGTRCHSS